MINPFPTIHPVYLIYFFGGAAFLFLGFSIGTKNMSGSNLRIADSLWMLAIFGLLHGLREWMEIYPLLEGEHLNKDQLFGVAVISAFLLIASLLFLLQFGLSLSRDTKRGRAIWTAGTYAALCVLWMVFVDLRDFGPNLLTVRKVQLGARNVIGLAGGAATSFAMLRYAKSREMKDLPGSMARNLSYAGAVFAVFAVVTTSLFSQFSNTYLPYSKEIFRGLTAVLIAYFVLKALNIFDIEMRVRVERQTKQLDQAEKLASLGRLAAGIAHEMNNPLTNASLGIQLIRKNPHGQGGRPTDEQLGAVERNIDRAAAIAQELLQFSRRQEAEFLPVNINEAITHALALMKHRLDAVTVKQNLAPVPDVTGDQLKLEQVFINILSNALEAMPGGGTISISTAVEQGMVKARIADTGTGIAEENIPKVFDPFFTTKETGSGTGLGLYLCYSIIRQHHGLIELVSAVGRGTTITISIPVRA